MSGSTVTSVPGRSRPITCPSGRIWIWKRRDAGVARSSGDDQSWLRINSYAPRSFRASIARASILSALNPVLEHLQCHCAILCGGLRDRLVVACLDPGLVRPCAVARQGEPHQAARRLPGQPLTVEQHLAEQRLRLVLALLGGKPEPACAIGEIIPRRVRR